MPCNTKKDLSKIIVKEDLLTVDVRELTVSLEALKFAIDPKEGEHLVVDDISGAFLQADMDTNLNIIL